MTYSLFNSLLKYSIFLVEPSLRMGDLNADASASSMPPINSSAHNISPWDRMVAVKTNEQKKKKIHCDRTRRRVTGTFRRDTPRARLPSTVDCRHTHGRGRRRRRHSCCHKCRRHNRRETHSAKNERLLKQATPRVRARECMERRDEDEKRK